jgi:hypothetical protein
MADDAFQPSTEIFLTDKELCARWRCSHMKLWRLRNKGKLKQPTKIVGIGVNLNRLSDVLEAEGGGHVDQAA